jgi:hypothetical protein
MNDSELDGVLSLNALALSPTDYPRARARTIMGRKSGTNVLSRVSTLALFPQQYDDGKAETLLD